MSLCSLHLIRLIQIKIFFLIGLHRIEDITWLKSGKGVYIRTAPVEIFCPSPPLKSYEYVYVEKNRH